VEAGDMYEAFRLLGASAQEAIESLETARNEGYDVEIMEYLGEYQIYRREGRQ
jgi:hypothetical protein